MAITGSYYISVMLYIYWNPFSKTYISSLKRQREWQISGTGFSSQSLFFFFTCLPGGTSSSISVELGGWQCSQWTSTSTSVAWLVLYWPPHTKTGWTVRCLWFGRSVVATVLTTVLWTIDCRCALLYRVTGMTMLTIKLCKAFGNCVVLHQAEKRMRGLFVVHTICWLVWALLLLFLLFV